MADFVGFLSPETIYDPLSSKSHEIRIMNLQTRPTPHLCAELETVSFTNPGEYVALSYLWGDDNETVSMEIYNPNTRSKAEFRAKANLYAALQHLDYIGCRRIWVDAICINQADDEERSLQVRNMQLIYSKARQVIASIGEVEPAKARAIQSYIKNFQSERQSLENIVKFFAEPYWTRVWVIQEIAVAETLYLMYGGLLIAWSEIATILSDREVLHYLGRRSSYAKQIMRLRDNYHTGVPITLFQAMQWTHRSVATIPRDKIFALLGLSNDGSKLVPLPNYSQDLSSLFTEMTVQMLNMDRSLDLICLGGQKRRETGPSWVPDWLKLWSYSTSKTLLESRILQERVPDSNFRKIPLQKQPGILSVRGAYAGIVKNVSTRWENQILQDLSSDEFKAIYLPEPSSNRLNTSATFFYALAHTLSLGWHNVNNINKSTLEDVSQSRNLAMLWTPEGRGMVKNIYMIQWLDWNATIPTADGDPSGLFNLAQVSRLYFKSTKSIFTPSQAPHPQVLESFTRYVDKVTETLSSGLRFVLTSRGKFGMAPPDTQERDVIYFLEGSSYPVILRPFSNNRTDYTVVGASYFHKDVLTRPNDSQLKEINIH